MRLDAYLSKNYPGFSRSAWAEYIKAGYVEVDKKMITNTSFTNFTNDSVFSINIPKEVKNKQNFPIIYEDENLIVINKPAGVLTHSKGTLNDEYTVSDFILEQLDKKPKVYNNRFGIVHRLDRATSGILIGAKNDKTLSFLQKQFQDRKVKKIYQAVVDITPAGQKILEKNGDNFKIDLPIARNPKKPSTFSVNPNGKNAITDVKVVKKLKNNQVFLELEPLTGRTHQLRVHLVYLGLPIVGDLVYNPKQTGDRMMLHAYKLEIVIPEHKKKTFKAELPDEFNKY